MVGKGKEKRRGGEREKKWLKYQPHFLAVMVSTLTKQKRKKGLGGWRGGRGRKRGTHGKPKKRDNKNDIYQTM